MPNESKPDQPQICEDALRNFILLALPWLSFQGDMLEVAKKSITDASTVKPTENFTLRQLHALMMIMDRSRTWRNLVDSDFEKRVEHAYNELIPKVTSASVQLIDAQQKILTSVFETLDDLRKGDKAKNYPRRRQ
jgi:hypothetical protein